MVRCVINTLLLHCNGIQALARLGVTSLAVGPQVTPGERSLRDGIPSRHASVGSELTQIMQRDSVATVHVGAVGLDLYQTWQ